MFDLEKIRIESERLQKQLATLVGVELNELAGTDLLRNALTPNTLDLYKTVVYFGEEADRCRAARAYFTASLMCASAIEGFIAVFCLISEDEVQGTKTYLRFEGASYEEKVLKASFDKLISVASELRWVDSKSLSDDVLAAAIQDYPVFAKNMYSSFDPQRRALRANDFAQTPGLEMLKILQDLRNLIHPTRWPRLQVTLASEEFEADCKFCFMLSFEVLTSLFTVFSEKAQGLHETASELFAKLAPETRLAVRDFVSKLGSPEN